MTARVNLDLLKALRQATGASVGDCRAALEQARGDPAKAREVLRRKGAQMAQKREGRATGQGRIASYIHHDGRLGALVEVNCESDFVARTPEFLQFCKDLAMQVAAMNPQYVRPEDAPSGARPSDDMPHASCLLTQPFVKDQGMTVGDLLNGLIAKTGEKVVVRRFVRYAVGESVGTDAGVA